MMLRMFACMAVCLTALLPATAQHSVDAIDGSAKTGAALLAIPMNDVDAARPSSALEAAEKPAVVERRARAVATTVFRVLASQNGILLGVPDQGMDAYFHPPSSDDGEPIFRQAKKLYDDATTYRTERYDLSVDLLSLTCRLKLSLSEYLAGGAD